ncbi:hypothetical protein BC830DRAFT_1144022 [Chytriomyces sp. MP71]|nr:hypothetical protein BC830DRAFT_1144022 [Chytriomyces sp. MP71]
MTNPLTDVVPVTVPLHYYDTTADGERPYVRLFESDNLPASNFERVPVDQPLHSLRAALADPLARAQIGIDSTGFQVVDGDTSATAMRYADWEDDAKIRELYYAEVKELLKKVTGGSIVIIFDHTLRRAEREGEETPDTPDTRKPVLGVHVDQTPESGTRRVLRHAKEEGLDGELLLKGRAQLINVWRPLRGPVLDFPLAVADFRTLDVDRDLVPMRLLYPSEGPNAQPEGETFLIKHSGAHTWYFLEEMQPEEVLLLKCWENLPGGGVRTPHTAFKDPRYYGKEGIELRQSIEVRALVFHPLEE